MRLIALLVVMQQKIVIQVTMSCEKSRSKAMALVAKADGTHPSQITLERGVHVDWFYISTVLCVGRY